MSKNSDDKAANDNIENAVEEVNTIPTLDEPMDELREQLLESDAVHEGLANIWDELKEDEKLKDKTSEKAPASVKIIGGISLVAAILGLAIVGVLLWFLVISPAYNLDQSSGDLNFPQISTAADADMEWSLLTPSNASLSEDYLPLSTDTDATPTDAQIE